MPAEKNCSECSIQFNTLYRIRHLQQHYAKKAIMIKNEKKNYSHYQQISGSSPNRNQWNIYDKPALEAFRQYYGGQ